MGQSKCNYHFISDIVKSFLLVHDFLNPSSLLKSMVVIIHVYIHVYQCTNWNEHRFLNKWRFRYLEVSNIFFLLNLKTGDPVTNLLVGEEIKHRSLPADWCQDLVNTVSCRLGESFVSVGFVFCFGFFVLFIWLFFTSKDLIN